MLNLARLPNLVLGTSLVLLVGWWGYRLWGLGPGLLAMTLAALEPTVVAHSSFVATDVGWTLFATGSLYSTWEFCRTHSWKWLVAAGIATGLALASKYSAVVLFGIVPVIVGCYWLAGGNMERLGRANRDGASRVAVSAVRQVVLSVVLVAYIALTVVWATYFFQDPLLWWNGLRQVLEHNSAGHPAWFAGEHSQTGWLFYFPVALAVKTQIATLFLGAVSLLFLRRGKPLGPDGVVFVLVPLGMFLAALLLARINIGVRHALQVYPLLFILAGRVATIRFRPAWVGAGAIGLLIVFSAFSAYRIAPYPVAYFNELVGGPHGGRHILSDSNLDWGQGLHALSDYFRDEELDGICLSYFGSAPPEYYRIRYQYVPAFGPLRRPEASPVEVGRRELFAISDVNLKGIWFENHDIYAWLEEREPIATLAYSIYVYDITNDADAHFELAQVYLAEGLPEYATWELEKVLAIEPGHLGAKRLMESSAMIGRGAG